MPHTASKEWTVADPPKPKGKTAGENAAKSDPVISVPMRPDMAPGADKSPGHGSEAIAALNAISPDRWLSTLDGENAQTVGLILNLLKGETAGAVFKALPSPIRRDVSVYMATSVPPGTKIVKGVEAVLLAMASKAAIAGAPGCMGIGATCEFGQSDTEVSALIDASSKRSSSALDAAPRRGQDQG